MNEWTLAQPIIVPGRHADAAVRRSARRAARRMAQYDAESPRRVGPVFDDSPFYFATERPCGMPSRMRDALSVLVVPGARPARGVRRVRQAEGPAGRAVRGVDRLLRLSGLRLHHGRAGAAAEPDAAARPSDLHAVDPALHAARGRRHRQRAQRARPGRGRLPRRRGARRDRRVRAAAARAARCCRSALAARVAIAIALIAPLGLAMGMPFPRGLLRAGRGSLPAPPFYWGLNGIMSVVGSVGTVVVALVFGFHVAMIVGAACYLVAALAGRVIDRGPIESVEPS